MRTKPGHHTAAFLVAAVAILSAAAALAPSATAAVEYVRICDSYGVGFHYHPGTDICFNSVTRDARQYYEDAQKTWRWRMPNNPREFVKTPKKACKGKLLKFGDLTPASLTLNEDVDRWETAGQPIQLEPGQRITGVIYDGAWTGVGRGNFCMFYRYVTVFDPPDDDPDVGPIDYFSYVPLGCGDTGPNDLSATYSFVPDFVVPPAGVGPVSLVGANGERWSLAPTAVVTGGLSVWLCVEG